MREKIQMPDMGEESDGYHTFNELYDHRNLLFINLCLAMPNFCSWGSGYPGWPVIFCELATGQISYHVPEKFLPLFEKKIKRQEDYEWDGHSSKDVLARLEAYCDAEGSNLSG